jgi:heptosyltransferase-2
MDKILIIKTGAMGDVLRTTSLLNVLKGNITWVTKKESMVILNNNPFINKIIDFDNSYCIKNRKFDLVLSLDDEYECCKLASKVKTNEIIGAYLVNCNRTYTD